MLKCTGFGYSSFKDLKDDLPKTAIDFRTFSLHPKGTDCFLKQGSRFMAKWTKITLGTGRVIIKVTIVVGLTHVCSNVANINAKTVVGFDFEFFLVY